MSLNYRKFLVIIVTAIILIVAGSGKVQAGVQANKGGKSINGVSAGKYFAIIRRMETANGTLGKKAVLNDNYIDTTENGIDSHMALNTEIGTAVILTISEYGCKPTSSMDTTTGNESGIYQLGYGYAEYTSGICTESTRDTIKEIKDADSRYYNNYTPEKSIAGDRMGLFVSYISYPDTDYPVTYIDYNGSLKSDTSSTTGDGKFGNGRTISSRAVVVCGQGL